jgi:hypothetical protein
VLAEGAPDTVNERVNETPASDEPGLGRRRRMQFRLGALAAIAVVVGLVIWLTVGRDDSSSTSQDGAAVTITQSGLTSLAGALNQPIYWVGPMPNATYEMTRPPDGRILLGYVSSESSDKPHLTVGTYPIANAYAVTQDAAKKAGTVKIDIGGGAVAFYNKAYPLSAFVSYPGSGYQIEVYDPKPGRARALIASGKVKPVPGSPPESTGAVAVSAKGLAERAAEEHQPIYWAGPASKRTLELTKTGQRWFLLRYLPPGVEVGAGGPYLTIGTYPVTDAFAAVQRLTREDGAVSIELANGGLASVNPKHFPYSVFLAYPGSNYQVEVFDPSLARARRLVTSGKISAVG